MVETSSDKFVIAIVQGALLRLVPSDVGAMTKILRECDVPYQAADESVLELSNMNADEIAQGLRDEHGWRVTLIKV